MIKLKSRLSLVFLGSYFISLTSILAEAFTYPGMLGNKTYFSLAVVVTSMILVMIGLRLGGYILPRFMAQLNNWLVLPTSVIISVLFILVENNHYPNFVFSQYGIYYAVFSNIVFVSLITLLLSWPQRFYQRYWQQIILLLPIAMWLIGLILNAWPKGIFIELNKEDQIVEYLQAVLNFAAAGLVFTISFSRIRDNFWQGSFLLLIGLALFILGGEEISWGQRLLGFQTPSSVREINSQNELTFHNSAGFREYVGQAYTLLGIYGSLAWVLRWLVGKFFPKIFAHFKIFLNYSLPYWPMALYFFSIFAYNWYQSNFDYKINQFSEYSELILAMGIFIWMLINYVRYRSVTSRS